MAVPLHGVWTNVSALGVHQASSPCYILVESSGVKIVAYLDDFFVCGPSIEKARESLGVLRAILKWLGFLVNDEKSVKTPTERLEFLGFMIDSNSMTLSLTEKKQASISNICSGLLRAKCVSARELAPVLGLWCVLVVISGCMRAGSLQEYPVPVQRGNLGKWGEHADKDRAF